jgi:hypothetical protein
LRETPQQKKKEVVKMAGYNGFSMSNNAVSAYESGEMPLSRWTKTAIIDAVKSTICENEINVTFSMYALEKCSAAVLKNNLLVRTSWHHTSSYFNKTVFYEIDINRIESLTDDIICSWKTADAKKVTKKEPAKEMYEVEYLVWSGSRNHPKATAKTCVCEVVGNWAITPDGKKSTSANGFRFIKKIDAE